MGWNIDSELTKTTLKIYHLEMILKLTQSFNNDAKNNQYQYLWNTAQWYCTKK